MGLRFSVKGISNKNDLTKYSDAICCFHLITKVLNSVVKLNHMQSPQNWHLLFGIPQVSVEISTLKLPKPLDRLWFDNQCLNTFQHQVERLYFLLDLLTDRPPFPPVLFCSLPLRQKNPCYFRGMEASQQVYNKLPQQPLWANLVRVSPCLSRKRGQRAWTNGYRAISPACCSCRHFAPALDSLMGPGFSLRWACIGIKAFRLSLQGIIETKC